MGDFDHKPLIEAAKKTPTLADRLEDLWEKRGRQGFELGIVREFAEILRGEDKSPVKALAREFVDGYPTKMWPQELLVEAFREALALEPRS